VLEKLCFRDAWDASALTGILANPAVGAMGWADRGETVAYLIYLRVADEAEILRIGVPPPQRRSGHAARLLSHFLDWARRAGIARVYLEVRPGNTAALALYRRAGFRHAGKRQKYYRDPVEDALVLEYEVPSATPGG
jgi:ribosomal-protein-alanine N-acetyltransferase